ncbi:MAG: NAD(P)/FAD-dependent oxidoreductase [Lentisphaerae bacterium]|jgi:phytoene dehydrogenase-like protein|nr:NAD(P)/FAD-dependent oxidoreductase [Lentisphaerota bacterium]MBT4819199.1 NAD(P)/FAD-dependent oxidoreductase [Lentisphaerota bacterium]MBT5606608.1 NAD(P)/FAD-dependent oxidoreductase [Lentisphaerota bacterium]MBT7059549.1 NAD(P)/FAD-dependent oxidoreductase [Lentisphaerota bacterium]MBT7843014.1 NAD(P)/FAD-dependent oxidoreductase [Lentisphaerota bacterium]
MHYDIAIIGAGMSGLAAGIRLAHYDKSVCILERHSIPGGLNSYYRRQGIPFDVGLHAVTNLPDAKNKRAPLNRLLRQLRLRRDDLDICEQTFSTIAFPDSQLIFTNDVEDLCSSVADVFPREIDGFRALISLVRENDSFTLSTAGGSARERLAELIRDPVLNDMILCPLMFYGNAREHDMDFNQFCIMFESLFFEGFWRPAIGVRQIIDLLTNRYRACGGELLLRKGVRQIRVDAGSATALELDDASEISVGAVLSSAGYPETMAMCDAGEGDGGEHPAGELGFVESIFVLNQPARDFGLNASIEFFSESRHFHYGRPNDLVDFSSGVICAPRNFAVPDDERSTAHMVRLTHLADYGQWFSLAPDAYAERKNDVLVHQRRWLDSRHPGLTEAIIATDMFTPKTIKRYTGHINGTVYGSPVKCLDGTTPIDNLFICGTDQGFLGIVGAMLSGVSMANLHLMR